MSKTIRIGTRKSALALVQTQLVADGLRQAWPGIEIEIVTKDTLGDRILDRPLQEFGGKGVFVSEFENAMMEGTIDLAVHSAKDLPMYLAEGLCIAAVSRREDPRDVLVTVKGRSPEAGRDKETDGCVTIGTSSPRRQLEAVENRELLWPGAGRIECTTLRGNVHTRLKKLEEGLYDGIILAAAGLKRLGLTGEDAYNLRFLDTRTFIPAGGQGLMAVEAVQGSEAAALCRAIDHSEERLCLTLEREVLRILDAGCHEPIGIHSSLADGRLTLWGISRKQGETRKVCLEGGISQDEIQRLAAQAGKGLM